MIDAEVKRILKMLCSGHWNVTFTAAPNRLAADTEYPLARIEIYQGRIDIYEYDHPDAPANLDDNSTLYATIAGPDAAETLIWLANINMPTSGLWARANGTGAELLFYPKVYDPIAQTYELADAPITRTEGADTLETTPPDTGDLGSYINMTSGLTGHGTPTVPTKIVLCVKSDTNITADDVDLPVIVGVRGHTEE